ncbi:MAG: FTR1 family protein [Alphaproteobacteria bacterium]|nr:FTR1 family protein [Alphaproteobacteria bacterium]
MLSTAIVVFREALEMAMIIGIILAATRGLSGRMLWIAGGFAGGIAGAGLVAFFTETISSLASGLGQELLNAFILFAASLVIGWTVLWMRKHFRSMTSHIKKVGHDVAQGTMPLYSLSLVIGLAVLREASEIVLFIYGMILSGQGVLSIAAGSLAGALSGVTVGAMIYFGLLKMSTQYMFKVTNILLILLVAGLSAQGAVFLSAAGYFEGYSLPMWDSSWLISDAGIAGKVLHGLIGYSAHPTLIQGIFYVATLTGLFGIIAWMESDRKPARAVMTGAVLLGCLLVSPGPARAADKIYSPIVHEGELELEYSGSRTFDGQHDKNNIQSHEVEVAYGVNSRWKTELTGEFEKEPDESFVMSNMLWENVVQFSEQGEYWLDAGALVSYVHGFASHAPDAIEAKLLLEKEWGRFLHRANIGIEQEIGPNAGGGPDRSVNWSSRYRHDMHFEPGFEIQSGFGKANENPGFNEQEHYIGPAVYGAINRNIKYEAAYLAGISDAAADGAGRLLLEYETPLN